MDIIAGTLLSPSRASGMNEFNRTDIHKESEIPFKDFLTQAIRDVNNLQQEAEQKIRELSLGNAENFHQVVIATEKATLALQLLTQIQNKLVEAYQEIMRIQL